MSEDPIVKLPATILRATAVPVENFGTEDLKKLVSQMFKIMQDKLGVGLAAPQIGESLRIFVYGFDSSPRYPGMQAVERAVAINPEIVHLSDETLERDEGCLSVPYKRGKVARAKTVTFRYFDIDGIQHEKTHSDFAARIVQHEIDHLNGILYIDRASEVRNSEII